MRRIASIYIPDTLYVLCNSVAAPPLRREQRALAHYAEAGRWKADFSRINLPLCKPPRWYWLSTALNGYSSGRYPRRRSEHITDWYTLPCASSVWRGLFIGERWGVIGRDRLLIGNSPSIPIIPHQSPLILYYVIPSLPRDLLVGRTTDNEHIARRFLSSSSLLRLGITSKLVLLSP